MEAKKYRVIAGYRPRILAGLVFSFEPLGELQPGEVVLVDDKTTAENGVVWLHVAGSGWVQENLMAEVKEL